MIGAKRVTARDGTRWRVGRRWLPARPRLRDRDDGIPADGSGDGGGGSSWFDIGDVDEAFAIALVLIAVVLVVLFFVTVIFPVLVLTLELLILLVVFAGGLTGRLVFRRPWTIRARRDGDEQEQIWHAKGFRRSGRVRDEIAEAIARGETDIRPTEAIIAVT